MVIDADRHRDRTRNKKVLLKLLLDSRRKVDLRQVELAKRLGLPQSFVSKYESGERRLDLLELQDVCAALGGTTTVFVQEFQRACADENSKDATADTNEPPT